MPILPRRIELNTFWPNASAATLVTYNPAETQSLFLNWAIWGGALNDFVDFYIPCEIGTYTITFICVKMNDCAKMTPIFGGTSLSEVDMYSASAARNSVISWTGINVTSPGIKTLRFKATGKNASSSNYYMKPHYVTIQRTDKGAELGKLAHSSRHIDIPGWMPIDASTGGGTWTFLQDSARLGGGSGYGPNPTNGATYTWYVALSAGTWTITHIYTKDVNRGMFDLSIGGMNVATGIDLYGSVSKNQVSTVSNINVGSDGVYAVKWTANGKNANSSSYFFVNQWLTFLKTS